MGKTFYVYAGYYELHVAAHKINRPLVLLSRHRSIERALAAAYVYDSDADIILYDDTIREVTELTGTEAENWTVAKDELKEVV